MQVYIPENLKFFRVSIPIYGKCEIEFEAVTGIVMSREERTTTRVYGDSTSVGSSVSVNQALWMQFEDGTEKCIDFQNTEERIARPGHFLTLLIARNLRLKNSLYVAFFNHATRDFEHFQRAAWKRITWNRLLWGNKTWSILGYGIILGLLVSLIKIICFTNIQAASAQFGLPFTIVTLTLACSIMYAPLIIVFINIFIGGLSNKVNKRFGNQIDQLMESFREQLTAS